MLKKREISKYFEGVEKKNILVRIWRNGNTQMLLVGESINGNDYYGEQFGNVYSVSVCIYIHIINNYDN